MKVEDINLKEWPILHQVDHAELERVFRFVIAINVSNRDGGQKVGSFYSMSRVRKTKTTRTGIESL
jgi:hypothetical protein